MSASASDLLIATARVLRLAQQHPINNAVFVTPIATLLGLLKQCEGDTTVIVFADTVFVNGSAVKLNAAVHEAAEGLRKLFARLAVHELTWPERMEEGELRAFLTVMQQGWQSAHPEEAFKTQQGRIRLRALDGVLDGSAMFSIDARQNVLRGFARVALVAKNALERAAKGQTFRTPNLRKAVQGMADASIGYESLLSGLTRFPNFSGALHFHLATVAALTMLMARKLKLPRAQMLDLVVAALLHDIGRAVPGPSEPLAVAKRTLVRLSVPPASEEGLLQAATAFELGLSANQRGVWAPGPAARLIAVPCAFDLLTSPTTGEKPLAPDQAVRTIREQSGVRFDPFAVDLFTATVGLFPVGSTVRLTGGQLAVVLEVPANSGSFARPVVKVIRENGANVDYVLDLSKEPDNAIAASVAPEEEGVNPPHFLLA
ncbi:MAG: HD domain-containing protein [Myxococcota bacterium]|jgi:HD-GYP domain-containing protein (c-di-GMP phosphodiesterase class II)